MRLTNQLRDQIIDDIIDKLLNKERTSIKKREQRLANECYNQVFTKKQRDAMYDIPRGWLPEDSCLRFNIGGMTVDLTPVRPMRVPFTMKVFDENGDNVTVGNYRQTCQRLGDIADETIKQKFLDLHADKEELKARESKIRRETRAMLDSVQTYNQLVKHWPEGAKFYAKYEPRNGDSQLPAIRVAELNKTLGLVAA